MPRPNDCIFCGDSAGSREHYFPASMGGRRTNKSILCENCNQHFGNDLDEILSEQLEFLNGFIGVRSDHRSEPTKARLTDPSTGEVFEVDGTGTPSLRTPKVIADEVIDGNRHIHVVFSSERQVQSWFEEMNEQGLKVQQFERVESKRLVPTTFPVQSAFGGPELLREIGRIALNFLAHLRPAVARREELRPFKDYVLGNAGGDCAWFDFDAQFEALPNNSFPFGHRVLIGLDTVGHRVYARVSLFSTFNFAVFFGAFDPYESTAIVVDLDPLADHPPDDIRVDTMDGRVVAPVTPPKPHRDNMEDIRSRFGHLLQRIENKHWAEISDKLLPQLNETRLLSPAERTLNVGSLLDHHRQAILLLLVRVIEEFKASRQGGPHDELLTSLFEHFVVADARRPTGVERQTDETIDRVRDRMAAALSSRIGASDLDDEELRNFLRGRDGIVIAAEVMRRYIENAIRAFQESA